MSGLTNVTFDGPCAYFEPNFKMKYKIKEVITKKDNIILPILAQFQNGSISPEEAQQMDCYTVDSSMKNKRKVVAFKDDNVYHGVINENYQASRVNTYIAVANKKTKKIRIIQVDQCSMINDIYEVPVAVPTTPKQRDGDAATKILLTEFSGKKAKSYYDKNIRAKTNIDVLQDQLDASLIDSLNRQEENEDSFTKAKIGQDLHSESMFPPVNLNAITLKDVYDINNLIPKHVLENLKEEAINFLKNEGSFTLHDNYFYEIIGKIQNEKDPDSPENLNKVIICFYLDALARLLNIPVYKTIQQLSGNAVVFKDIQERFSSQNSAGRKILFTHRKAICYYLVFLMMLSDNFEILVDDILGIFKTSLLEIRNYASAIGGAYKSATNSITLKLPNGKSYRTLKHPRAKK